MKRFTAWLFVVTTAGLIFSGYLSAVKLFKGTCAFNEPCPFFLGYPACWYGFAMYLLMFLATGAALIGIKKQRTVFRFDAIVSGIGILFAGNFVIQEIMTARTTGILGFSTCVYGLIFYIIIFITSITAFSKSRASTI